MSITIFHCHETGPFIQKVLKTGISCITYPRTYYFAILNSQQCRKETFVWLTYWKKIDQFNKNTVTFGFCCCSCSCCWARHVHSKVNFNMFVGISTERPDLTVSSFLDCLFQNSGYKFLIIWKIVKFLTSLTRFFPRSTILHWPYCLLASANPPLSYCRPSPTAGTVFFFTVFFSVFVSSPVTE